MRSINLIFTLSSFTLFLSCGELFLGPDPENTPETNFQLLWEDYDKLYSRFDYKGVNWDSLYNVYRPQVNSYTTEEQLYRITSSMLVNLRDTHATLSTPYGTFYYSRKVYSQNFNFDDIKSNYLQNRKSFSPFTYGHLSDDIGYIFIDSFSHKGERYKFIDTLIQNFESFKGIVIDVRHNSGGNSSNADMIASRFADKKRTYSYVQWRNGPGHNDFTDLFTVYIKPKGKKRFTKPVVLLTNRTSCSATEDFVLMMKVIPQVIVVGDTTAGSIGGSPITRELPNGWIYRIPTARMYSYEHISYEGVGIPPDIPVWITGSDFSAGKDTILETAIQLLNKQSGG